MSRIIRISVQTEFNDLNNDGYDILLKKIRESFSKVANTDEPLFTTNEKKLI